jgi:hypothetical protein
VILKFGVLVTMTVAAVIVAAPPCLAKNNEAEPQTTNEAKDATTRPERRVWVHLDAAKGVLLQQSYTSTEWRDACVAPCDGWMRGGPYYRLVGGGLGTLAPFMLRASDGEHETVTVRPPAPGLVALGLLGVVAGGPTAVGATFVWVVGEIVPGSPGVTVRTSLIILAIVAGGAAIATSGVILIKDFQWTRVTQTVDTKPSTAAESGPETPQPIWSRATTESVQTPPPLAFVPLVSGSF